MGGIVKGMKEREKRNPFQLCIASTHVRLVPVPFSFQIMTTTKPIIYIIYVICWLVVFYDISTLVGCIFNRASAFLFAHI